MRSCRPWVLFLEKHEVLHARNIIFYLYLSTLLLGLMISIPSTTEWDSLVSASLNNDQPESPGPEEDAAKTRAKKRRRGLSPVPGPSRVQRPRLTLDQGLDALHALDPDQQEMVEEAAARGIRGGTVIHRFVKCA